jgi:hypothetical protein
MVAITSTAVSTVVTIRLTYSDASVLGVDGGTGCF